jgi:hypothetical protein
MPGPANRADGPIGNERCDLGAVLFQHQHVAVAVNATLFEPDEVNPNPGLPQILGLRYLASDT